MATIIEEGAKGADPGHFLHLTCLTGTRDSHRRVVIAMAVEAFKANKIQRRAARERPLHSAEEVA
jgi:hypothetical protein